MPGTTSPLTPLLTDAILLAPASGSPFMIVYLNGDYVPHQDARVSVDDRGFLFADGVYEVARIYDGHIFLLQPHLNRLRYGLSELRISVDIVDQIPDICNRLLDQN